jgi:glycerophosphoryl diester phosphodiesterase
VVVVTHDGVLNPDLTRTPDGAWLRGPGPVVRRLTLEQLRRFDVGRLRPGSATAALFPSQAPHDGARIPTLAEVLALTVPAGVRVEVELKTRRQEPEAEVIAITDAVLATAATAGALPLLGVRSFDWRGPRYLRNTRPEIPLTWLTRAHFFGSAPAKIATEAAAGPPVAWRPVWAAPHRGLTEALIEKAHALGLYVEPWTVNAPADMARLIRWGVDGLCSDRPDLARTAMAAAGLALPRAVSEPCRA